MMNTNKNLLQYIGTTVVKTFPNSLQYVCYTATELHISVASADIKKVAFFLQKHTNMQFKQLLDVFGVDYLGRAKRFEVNYSFLSLRYNVRVLLKTAVNQDAGLSSLEGIFKSANWLEREVWDMFGIFFLDILI